MVEEIQYSEKYNDPQYEYRSVLIQLQFQDFLLFMSNKLWIQYPALILDMWYYHKV